MRVLVIGVLLGLVALTVYLPGVLTASVTARDEGFRGFGGKFTTDPLALLAACCRPRRCRAPRHICCPTRTSCGSCPAALWLDWRRARREWRPLGGLLAVHSWSLLVIVDGPAQLGPLRWPLRLQPFLVEALVVCWSSPGTGSGSADPRRAGSRSRWAGSARGAGRPAPRAVEVGRPPGRGRAGGRRARPGLVAGASTDGSRGSRRRPASLTLVGSPCSTRFYPTPPSPQRNAPTELAAYRRPRRRRRRRDPGRRVRRPSCSTDPRAAAPAARLGVVPQPPPGPEHLHRDQPSASTRSATASSTRATPARRCSTPSSPPSRRPGRTRVDLLGVSSLCWSARTSRPQRWRTRRPAGGSPSRTPYTVLWTRRHPIAGAGGVAWTSPGTSVSAVDAGDRRHVVPGRRGARHGRHRGAQPARLARLLHRRGQPGRPRRRLPRHRPAAGLGRRARRCTSTSSHRGGTSRSARGCWH